MKKIYSAILLSIAVLSGCGSSQKDGKVKLSGAGATFPAPFYNNLFKSFSENSVHQVTYGAIGSGGGIRSLKDKTIDFGATDVFLSDDELKEMGAEVIHIPTALGAVVLSYNLPEIKDAKLKLSSELVSDIFRGTITKWNDAKIKAINPDLNLPDKTITPVYRSDGSGTTYVFSDYMSKTDENWQKDFGKRKSVELFRGGCR
ncbi:MAG: phosphate ABC transporter substrate-binding protein PstS [Dysgonomonas sp.]